MNGDTRAFLDAILAYQQSGKSTVSSDKNIRIATIDPYFTTGRPRVLFDGEPRMGERTYTWDSIYSPRGGDRVFMVPVGTTYIIAGAVAPRPTAPVFVDLPYAPNWSAFGDVYSPLRVTRTANGVVVLGGLLKSVAADTTGLITVLPEGFRPKSLIRLIRPADRNGVAYQSAIMIRPTGEVYFSTSGWSWVTLEGITFNNSDDLVWNTPTLLNGWVQYDATDEYPLEYAKDRLNRVWLNGFGRRPGGIPAGEIPVFTLPEGFRPEFQQHYLATQNPRVYLPSDVLSTGEVRAKVVSAEADLSWISFSGINFVEKSVTNWTNLPYSGSWRRNSTGQPEMSYHKDADGIVHLRGLITGGGIPSVITTLPEGCRPKYRQIYQTASTAMGPTQRVDIQSNGVVSVESGKAGWMSLDQIQFVAEQ